ncbi:glycosyltransferase [Botrimarina mediterranea]|uniref:glycosyltransferase n=1 Tax=Botrimarina mediterranea TaxID=2528022 RepID=UPI00118D47AE|nr:Glycosyl transferases group 1 [Planctomycetes bacterium K2D]
MSHVLHVIHDLDHSGAATQLRLLTAAAVARGEDVAVASLRRPGPQGERFVAAGVPVIWTAKRFRLDPFAVEALRRLVERRGAGGGLITWDHDSAPLGRILKRLKGAWWAHVHRGGAPPKLTGVDAVIAADLIAAQSAKAVTSAPVTIAPNAYDPSLVPMGDTEKLAARARLRAAGWDIADGAPVVVCVTRIDDAVATKELAWASDLVRVMRPGLRLLVAGDGAGRLACERFAVKAVERGTVEWLGPCDALATLYAAADVVWVGRGAGATPTPAVEAMAAGKPVVMADGPGRETLLPQDTPPAPPVCRIAWNDRPGWAKATMRLLAEPALAAEIGAANAQRVRGSHDLGHTIEAWRAALAMGSRS